MSVLGIQLAVAELLVVLLDVACAGSLEEVVACVHLHAEALQRVDDLLHVGDDGLVLRVVLDLCEEVVHDGRVDGELHLLRIDHDELQLGGMFLI